MKRLISTAALVLTLWALVLSGVEAQGMSIPENGPSLLNPRVQAFLKGYGTQYGLKATEEGKLLYVKPDVKTGRMQDQVLNPVTVARLLGLMSDATPEEVEARMTMALDSYLQPRQSMLSADAMSKLFTMDASGRKRLTQMGRNLLMDILTAEDGLTFAPPTATDKPKKPKTVATSKALSAMQRAGILIVDSLAHGGLDAAVGAGGTAFDGLIEQGTRGLDGYDWNKEGDPVLIRKNREEGGLYAYAVKGKEGQADSEFLRVLIAAKTPVSIDRLKMTAQDADASVYAESGLDPALMALHGAKVVRAVDNLVAVDVPIAEAPKLGAALAEDGILSRPARMFKMVTDQMKKGPSWPDPLFSVLPFASGLMANDEARQETGRFTTMNAESRNIMKVNALAAKGMDGTGAVVGIVDSGLDITHPDFEDRVAAYIDLTDGGTKDFVGHGTHVAGSIGGSGKSSDGKYKGMAPGTKYVILKVFGAEGSTSEDTILAALKAAKSLPADIRPQVINMSLGGPGDPETDPLSVMANEMMVKDNIVMAIAAGNSGPGKKTIGSPGNARFVMTVTGTNKESKFPFFPSRGPIVTSKGKTYNKPDISTISGDVSTTNRLKHMMRKLAPGMSDVKPQEEPTDPGCFYAPGGVISTRSKDDADTQCTVKGAPGYRYMTGTSMATPLAAGIAADVVGYMKSKNHAYKASEVKALMMETATDLKEKPEVQGAGMVDGEKLAKVLEQRVKMGLPVGNVAFAIAHRTSRWDEFNMKKGDRFEHTSMGLLDKKTGHLIHNDAEFDAFTDAMETEYKAMPIYSRLYRSFQYWWNG